MPGPSKPTRACGRGRIPENAHKQELRQTQKQRNTKHSRKQMGAHHV